MSLKTWFSRLAKPVHKLRERIRSTSQLVLFLRFLSWWGFLRFLQPVLSVQQMVRLATFGGRRYRTPTDVLNSLNLFYDVCLLAQTGDCLPRALVSHRFLTMAGLDSKVVIGFNGAIGHSWVELVGKPFYESDVQVRQYRPALFLGSGDRRLVKVMHLKDTPES